jgi:glycosyltransferase involved in cell wall biosynthesis
MIATIEQTGVAPSPTSAGARRIADGVICLGGVDWWYHNRGHYDVQMMRQLASRVPVLYVNSIGMRVPRLSEGRVFLKRVGRKLRSLGRGLVTVERNFAVFSPVAAPGSIGARVTRRILPAQIRWTARRCGIRRPLLWVACPPGAEVLDAIPHVGLVYQRTDRYETFHGVVAGRIAAYDRDLKRRADLTLFCSTALHQDEAASCAAAAYVDHGVDFDRFEAAGKGRAPQPADVAGIPRPRIGFVGGVDRHTFDAGLFVEAARRCPDLQFVIIGGSSLPEDWCTLANVWLLGRRDYTEVAAYMAACDVLIMPWNRSEWIKACNPVKLKEYLAVGRPVVSTPFPELARYDGLVRIASEPAAFVAAIRAAVADGHDPGPGRERVRAQSWRAKSDLVVESLERSGIVLTAREELSR